MLKKILKEEYKKIMGENKAEQKPMYFINKILDKLRPYIRGKTDGSPGCIFHYDGEIPSIPGGRLHITEKDNDIAVVFSYLEGAPSENLKQVRQAIEEVGLERIVE